MPIYAPTLSTRGWSKTPETIIDTIFTHYISNNPSQSYTYRGEVFSLQSAIQQGSDNIANIANNIQVDLNKLFSRYFPLGAVIECTYNQIEIGGSLMNINISGYVVTEAGELNVMRALENIDSHFIDISNIKIVK